MSNLKNGFLSVSVSLCRLKFFAATVSLSTLATANPPCPADFDGDSAVTGADISLALMDFGACGAGLACPSDLDGDAEVTAADISLLLMDFGDCPNWYTVLEDAPDPAVVWDATHRAAIADTGKPWRVRDNGTGIEMVLIPPGTFTMGWSPSLNNPNEAWWENPRHKVTLTTPFYMSRTEVTQSQWESKMDVNPSCFTGDSSRPVEQVSRDEVQAFCAATGLRLASEAEWEFGYRAGAKTAFHGFLGELNGTDDDALASTIAWHGGNSGYAPHPVATKAANGFGLFDMAGNVQEFVQDRWGIYSADAQTNPIGPISGADFVVRGGEWRTLPGETYFCRASARGQWIDWYWPGGPATRSFTVGFRVVRNP